ncbi:UNVERIFIED_CONTAM: hypothetical protein PYX00_001347 [Menopon gallinae]|uniref:Inositol-1-monophosphatase n=1 Tax=Menopon gallinae TaxID=328185 RepID=A0AAW2IEH7_9NEOP
MVVDLEECYDTITAAVKHAGEIIKSKIWATKSSVECKSSDIDLVTEVDKQVETYLMTTISKRFPDHQFIGEESVGDGGKCNLTDAPTWIIDPIDGTMNFVHGYPNVCVSVGFLVNKVPEIGIIYNPVLELFFEARRGKGAKLNGNEIHASRVTDLSKALIGYECGTSRDEEKTKNVLENISKLVRRVQGLRALGSAALNMAMVALGGTDAYFEFGTHAWDVAAGDLIVREAGGVVIDPAGGNFDIMSRRVLCAGTQDVAIQLSKELLQFYPERD